ncbi:putative MPP superfamily phosphohydrolase [Silvibacterium bohemicum]|uniref:Putative MPP superfamily phosphohydrolase n=1 Tax=Silvibacterium bohemicum TaxID=1577686 RepID=A0A841JPL4_9BACT|nr:metallophosphoesterase [Silvibacterium bohemicum]MBB6142517.1 putative MPP superfamily phosphohydrolase [Silvibacterium bohemicum]
MTLTSAVTRRRFLRQSFAFSALASLGSFSRLASALPAGHPSSEILMIGDWGYDTDHAGQTAVADAMRKYAQQNAIRPEAMFFLGDNWYGPLEGGAQSPRWQTQFEDMYPASAFNCPAYSVLGNHDYQVWPMSKVDAELEYARSGKSRFTMPDRWYTFEFPAKNPLVTFIALDSNVPHGDGITSHGRDFTLTAQQHAEQLAWLESELSKPRKTPYLVVIAHHPVYSDGPHGDHAILIRDWDPLFRKHGVQLYLAGHDHDLQHLEFEGHPTSFFLSGGGGADLYNLKIQESARGPFAQKIYGFSQLSVTKEKMTLRHLDSDGKLLHEFSKTPEGKITVAG